MTDSSELPELQKTDTGAQTGATDTGAYKSKLQKLLELRVTDRPGATGSTVKPLWGATDTTGAVRNRYWSCAQQILEPTSNRYYWSCKLQIPKPQECA